MSLLPLMLMLACSGGDSGADGDDGDGGVADGGISDGGTTTADTGDPCLDAPVVTWNNFGQGFVTTHCQGCHASTTANRYGAPEDVVFDTVEDVWVNAYLVLVAVAGDDPYMPPAGGVPDDDIQKLRWWLECAEPGT